MNSVAALLLIAATPPETTEPEAAEPTVEKAAAESDDGREPMICRSVEVFDSKAMRGRRTTKMCKTREAWKSYSRGR